ncbi:uncharacterized protein LOC119359368 [Triticum dicoccoides]|uniref:uncharacterized protein LOC119359368 n=1 Tax=Triticum dicoccoides TaxID=85692 RepID=UPI0018901694|nr:uncharacterized protein LOC119359368 [Triticum dicoccoides]
MCLRAGRPFSLLSSERSRMCGYESLSTLPILSAFSSCLAVYMYFGVCRWRRAMGFLIVGVVGFQLCKVLRISIIPTSSIAADCLQVLESCCSRKVVISYLRRSLMPYLICLVTMRHSREAATLKVRLAS